MAGAFRFLFVLRIFLNNSVVEYPPGMMKSRVQSPFKALGIAVYTCYTVHCDVLQLNYPASVA